MLDLAEELEAKATEHEHYAQFSDDPLLAAEHHGISTAFRFLADKFRSVVLREEDDDD